MIACGLSTLELRSLVEGSFLPLHCTCTVAPDYSMTVKVDDPASGQVELLVAGISLHRLKTSRDISDLVAELRNELQHTGATQVYYRTA